MGKAKFKAIPYCYDGRYCSFHFIYISNNMLLYEVCQEREV
jgi:hypothetical protein